MKGFFGILLFFVFFWTACSKAPEYPIEPQIQFKSMTKYTMLQSFDRKKDSLVLTILFTDGDGDLGSPESIGNKPPDVFIIDKSDNNAVANPYTLPYIAKKGETKGINGEISFAIYTACCTVPGSMPCEKSITHPTDTILYAVTIQDRAGHKSNELKLPPIILICNQ
jgi:hypothetical protein